MIVVSDTTPLNYLVLIDQPHLLHELYGRVLIPEAVRDEMQRTDTPEKGSGALNQFAILFDGRVPMGGLGSNSLTQSQN